MFLTLITTIVFLVNLELISFFVIALMFYFYELNLFEFL